MTPGVLARAKGCPEVEAVAALRDACMEFCTKTYALTTAVKHVLSGPVANPQQFDTQVVDVVEARVAGKPVFVTFANDPQVDVIEGGAVLYLDGNAYEYALTFQDPSYMTLTPAPTADAPVTLDLLLVIAPGPTATSVHDVLWLRHSEAIKSGALARLLAEGPWSNLPSAAYHGARFQAAVAAASADYSQNRRKTARRLRVRPASI